jgi:hypothetical protein
MNMAIVNSIIIISMLSYSSLADSGSIHESVPSKIDPTSRYLFFLHGKIVEKKGVPASSKKYGDYEYKEMLQTFADDGFEVISEARSKGTDIHDYSSEITESVEKLINAGTPAKNITVSGFSKGGRMTLVISSLLDNKDVNFVVLAGCRTSDIDNLGLNPVGKVLSIYDSNDDKFESCSKIFAAGDESLKSNELVLSIGDGHGVFYQPMDEWVQPMLKWAKQ